MFSEGLFICVCVCVHAHSKAINREYEEYVLTVGDFDERVFLGADADEEIGTPRKVIQEASAGQATARSQLQQHVEKVHAHMPHTGHNTHKQTSLQHRLGNGRMFTADIKLSPSVFSRALWPPPPL